MKNLLFTFLLFISSFTYGQYNFKVTVDSIYANKETVALLDDHISTINRYIDGNVIRFSTFTNHSELYIDFLFNEIGIDPISVIKDKTLATQSFEKAGGNNCDLAELLCSGSSITGVSNGPGTIQELNGTNQGCLGVEHQSSWYYVNIQTGGSLTFLINPNNNNNDYDFAVWGPFTSSTANANCPPITQPIRCSFAAVSGNGNTGLTSSYTYSCGLFGLFTCTQNVTDNSEGAGGDSWVTPLNTLAGEVYIVMIDNWSVSNQGYDLSFGGTSTLGCTPVILPIELKEFTGEKYQNVGNILKWKTESEHNNDYFLLDWSINPENNQWTTIATIQGNGTTTDEKTYGYVHNTFKSNKINYYRLTQVDTDGSKTVYNDLVAINNTIKEKKIIKIINMLGQEVNEDTKGVLIYYYEDGTFERIYQ